MCMIRLRAKQGQARGEPGATKNNHSTTYLHQLHLLAPPYLYILEAEVKETTHPCWSLVI